jgi:hypothetical protein
MYDALGLFFDENIIIYGYGLMACFRDLGNEYSGPVTTGHFLTCELLKILYNV